jgi:hypothetical protein
MLLVIRDLACEGKQHFDDFCRSPVQIAIVAWGPANFKGMKGEMTPTFG